MTIFSIATYNYYWQTETGLRRKGVADGYIFHLPDGTPISEKRLQNEIDKTVKRINTDGIEFDRFDNNKIFILPFLSRLTAMARWAWIF